MFSVSWRIGFWGQRFLELFALLSLFSFVYNMAHSAPLEDTLTNIVIFLFMIFARITSNRLKPKTADRDSSLAREIKAVVHEYDLEYQERSAPRHRPLFENTALAHRDDEDDAGNFFFDTAPPREEILFLVRGTVEGQFIEAFVQEAVLKLRHFTTRKDYFVVQTDVSGNFSPSIFFVTPTPRTDFSFFNMLNTEMSSPANYERVSTESPEFNRKYAIWVKKEAEDRSFIYQILTPEFLHSMTSYPDPLYIEVVYDRMRVYHESAGIDASVIRSLFHLILHMKNNMTRHQHSKRPV